MAGAPERVGEGCRARGTHGRAGLGRRGKWPEGGPRGDKGDSDTLLPGGEGVWARVKAATSDCRLAVAGPQAIHRVARLALGFILEAELTGPAQALAVGSETERGSRIQAAGLSEVSLSPSLIALFPFSLPFPRVAAFSPGQNLEGSHPLPHSCLGLNSGFTISRNLS